MSPRALPLRHHETLPVREKVVQRKIMALYRAAGCHVYNLSQSRATNQTPGLPDLWVTYGKQVAWWHEVKAPTKRATQSPPQRVFQEECEGARVTYLLGGYHVAEEWLLFLGLMTRLSSGLAIILAPSHRLPAGIR